MDPQTKDRILGHLDTASEIANAVKGNRGASLRSQLDPARKLVAAEPTTGSPEPEPEPTPPTTVIPPYRLVNEFATVPTAYPWQIQRPFTSYPVAKDGVVHIQTPPTQAAGSMGSYSRWVWEGSMFQPKGEGDEVWFGGTWRFDHAVAWSRFMCLAYYSPTDPDIYNLAFRSRGQGQFEVSARRYHSDAGESILVSNLPIPQGRMFDLDVHAKLSATDGKALTEVFVDSKKVGVSTKRNMVVAKAMGTYQGGLAYYSPENPQQTVLFDWARLS